MMKARVQEEGDAAVAAQADRLSLSPNCWYFSREHIEQLSPSREDGIDPAQEALLRKSYCTFLQKLGRQLKMPQVTIATAIMFCHRFFLRQSHAKSDRYIIATVCMFLAGKVEETPEKLHNVIFLSYEMRNSEDQGVAQKLKQKEVYDEQKELLLLGERLVLATLGFDLNVLHPYKPLIAAIKRLKLPQKNALPQLAQVAWNFVNDGLQTTLCLQFKPCHVAAGAIHLAAKFLKVKLSSDWEKMLWQEFEISSQQLEDISIQIVESYGYLVKRSTVSLGFNMVSCVAANHNKGAANEACPATPQDEEQNQWPLQQDKHLGESLGEKKMQNSGVEMDDTRSRTAQSDLTDEKEVLERARGYEDKNDNQRGLKRSRYHLSSSTEDADTRSVAKPWLDGWERDMGKGSSRFNSPVGPSGSKRDTRKGVSRHPSAWLSGRDKDMRTGFSRRGSLVGPSGRERDMRRGVSRHNSQVRLSGRERDTKKGIRWDSSDVEDGRVQNREKFSCYQPHWKAEMGRYRHGHTSRNWKERGNRRPRYDYAS